MKRLWRKILEAKVLDKKLRKVKYFGCKLTPFFVQNFQGYEEVYLLPIFINLQGGLAKIRESLSPGHLPAL
ncbi:uncharacterized protein OCT59_007845 [Rhizophagus irregularis]|uniref:Uncharacterized protein n=2 Tax=Rhizophagus irregularis TaxID=588596 RepID=A0A916EAA1_9GLOM|nr:hypothetical protein OCT59_007845 [Rhizophagus irregularis]CAB4493768.1 unnamed protein product [Rhizophagus irregularis]CAB5207090.1 unnamed protein product [Rhizophagus irregularis]CAB5371633.1 unnamed protein product [Rhizophagus irregularis]